MALGKSHEIHNYQNSAVSGSWQVLDTFYLSLNMNFVYLHPESGEKPTRHVSSAKDKQ